MPYRHYGNIGDIWKHLPLCTILEIERPRTYIETNSAYATYALEATPRQQYGVIHTYRHAARSGVVAGSRYMAILREQNHDAPEPHTYLGSPALAMTVLKETAARFVFCDIEAEALENVAAYAASLALEGRVTTVLGDSISGTYRMLDTLTSDDFIHIDPYTIFEPNAEGLTYFDTFLEATRRGIKSMLWYGYFTGDEQREMETRFQAEMVSASTVDGCHVEGVEIALDLIQPDTIVVNPGIVGCCVLTSNLSRASRDAISRLAEGLVAIYDDSTVFGTHSGRLQTRSVVLDGSSMR
ncbi:MAG: hypothetical protein MUQ30_04630 [Anaerolineae bacterium]|nr:hypothetical protein [Anaerolineae bacterium]